MGVLRQTLWSKLSHCIQAIPPLLRKPTTSITTIMVEVWTWLHTGRGPALLLLEKKLRRRHRFIAQQFGSDSDWWGVWFDAVDPQHARPKL